jgi:hypothetical protein
MQRGPLKKIKDMIADGKQKCLKAICGKGKLENTLSISPSDCETTYFIGKKLNDFRFSQ